MELQILVVEAEIGQRRVCGHLHLNHGAVAFQEIFLSLSMSRSGVSIDVYGEVIIGGSSLLGLLRGAGSARPRILPTRSVVPDKSGLCIASRTGLESGQDPGTLTLQAKEEG